MIGTFAKGIVGGKVSQSAKPESILDALKQTLYVLGPAYRCGHIHPSDRLFYGLIYVAGGGISGVLAALRITPRANGILHFSPKNPANPPEF